MVGTVRQGLGHMFGKDDVRTLEIGDGLGDSDGLIETTGGYIEIQRGNNCIQIRPEYFFVLLYKALENDSDKKEVKKAFAKKLRERNVINNIDNELTDDELSLQALNYGDDFFEFALSIAEGVSNPLIGIIKGIRVITKIAKKHIGG